MISVPGFGMGGSGKSNDLSSFIIRLLLKDHITKRLLDTHLVLYQSFTDMQFVLIEHGFVG